MSAAAVSSSVWNHSTVEPVAPIRIVGSTAFICRENSTTSAAYCAAPGLPSAKKSVSLPIDQYLTL